MTVNIALRRALHQLQFYTEGNIPESLIGVPKRGARTRFGSSRILGRAAGGEHSGPASCQVRSGLAEDPGDGPGRSRTILTNGWLCIVCFAFSISPTPFVKTQNRATAESAQEQALIQGLRALMGSGQKLVDLDHRQALQRPDLNFGGIRIAGRSSLAAQIHQIYVQGEDQDHDEVRASWEDPLTAAETNGDC